MPATYEPIATTTLGSAAASYTFSSIPATYTDLVLVSNFGLATAGNVLDIRFNSDTGNNYSYTILDGNGTVAESVRGSNQSFIPLDYTAATNNLNSVSICNIQNYSNTTTNKTSVIRHSNASSGTDAIVGLWRNTAAISTIVVFASAGNIIAGSTFTLYGIKSA
jgi:hypothetical protein